MVRIYTRTPMMERFMSKVSKEGECWLWTAAVNSWGYGQIRDDNSRQIGAHIASYMLFRGDVPNGMTVLHSCDNPLCVNPEHLSIGTQAENIADCVRKGRNAKGERQHSSKLTEDDVVAIRIASGIKYSELSKKYMVNPTTIKRIRERIIWRHIP